MSAPIDATTTAAWATLTGLREGFCPRPARLVCGRPGRAQRFTREAADLHVDPSKNLVTDEVLDALVALGTQVGLEARRDAMFAGERINVTENRSVLHTALRRPAVRPLVVEGQDVDHDVHAVLERVYAFADSVRSGSWRGVTGMPITTVVNIGIGGSDLGPVMVYEALTRMSLRVCGAGSSRISTPPTSTRRPATSTRRRRWSSSRARPSPPWRP